MEAKAKQFIEFLEGDSKEDIATLKNFDSMFKGKFSDLGLKVYQQPKFNDYLGYGATAIYIQTFPAKVSPESEIKPRVGNSWRAMIWLKSDINPHGVTGASDIGRTFTINYQLKGLVKASKDMSRHVKSGAIEEWSEAEVLKFYAYARTPDEVIQKFSQWIDSTYKEFHSKYSS